MGSFVNRLAARTLGIMPLAEPFTPARFTPESPLSFNPESSRNNSYPPEELSGPVPEYPTARPEPFNRVTEPPSRQARATPQSQNIPAAEPPHQPASPHNEALSARVDRTASLPEQPHSQVENALLREALPKDSNPSYESVPENFSYDSQTNSPTPIAAFPEPTTHSRQTIPREQHATSASHLDLQQTEAQPVVHVSIGRIEVRAEIVSTPPAPTRTRPKPATLSLSQFLQQRGTGPR